MNKMKKFKCKICGKIFERVNNAKRENKKMTNHRLSHSLEVDENIWEYLGQFLDVSIETFEKLPLKKTGRSK
jgi:hypothetical protein